MGGTHKTLLVAVIAMLPAYLLIASAAEGKKDEAVPEGAKSISAKAEEGVLTDKQIASLKTEYTDEKTKKSYKVSSCSITVTKPATYTEKVKLKKSGKVPIRIIYSLYETNNGRRTRVNGTCNMYVKDADGKVVLKQSIAASKMCPS